MKIKYVKLESPSGVPTYRRPSIIPGTNVDDTDVYMTAEKLFADIRLHPAGYTAMDARNADLVSYSDFNKYIGAPKMFQQRNMYNLGELNYPDGNKYYFDCSGGQGMMSRIGNSYASLNMYDNSLKTVDDAGNKIYSWNSIWSYNAHVGSTIDTVYECKIVKNDNSLPFELSKDYILMYYVNGETGYAECSATKTGEWISPLPDVDGFADFTLEKYLPNQSGDHGIKQVMMLGIKFYNADGTTSHYEAEADKPYSTVYGEYPHVPQSFSCVKFKHTKEYTKAVITRRVKNGLSATPVSQYSISYPFIAEYAITKLGSIDRKDILNNEVVLGGNYPAGTSKEAYVSYDLYTEALPCDITAGNVIGPDFVSNSSTSYGITTSALQYNIGSFEETISSIEKTSITKNDVTPDSVANNVYGDKFKCYDVTIKAVNYTKGFVCTANSYSKEGYDGYPSIDSGGCSGES